MSELNVFGMDMSPRARANGYVGYVDVDASGVSGHDKPPEHAPWGIRPFTHFVLRFGMSLGRTDEWMGWMGWDEIMRSCIYCTVPYYTTFSCPGRLHIIAIANGYISKYLAS